MSLVRGGAKVIPCLYKSLQHLGQGPAHPGSRANPAERMAVEGKRREGKGETADWEHVRTETVWALDSHIP